MVCVSPFLVSSRLTRRMGKGGRGVGLNLKEVRVDPSEVTWRDETKENVLDWEDGEIELC